jgi:phosphopantothenoylcysteine decarboxylase/phosphopantothenate--cysteine ligase
MANTLTNRRILLGISGGIAAYKSAVLCRELVRRGADVRVVMTAAATRFITPMTLQALSGHPVQHDLFAAEAEHGMGHIELARWAELILIAPATAQTITRIVHGTADDMLSATVLASKAPLCIAPAMNHVMWGNSATQANIATLKDRQVQILGPAEGEQACGESGPGRMLEPEELAVQVERLLSNPVLRGKQVVITAGPTWEAIDPVRGISNISSGKMGYAIAQAASLAGADCVLVSGPTHLSAPQGVTRIDVTSAQQMADAVMSETTRCDIFIAVAAVADYRPVAPAGQKIKKHDEYLNLELVRNPDILAMVAATDNPPFTVGFAAETQDLEVQARKKLDSKGVDLIAANPVGGKNSAFNADDNELLLIDKYNTTKLPRSSKIQLAHQLIEEIAKRTHETH